MRKISRQFLTFLLFMVGTYGERIFTYMYTLFRHIPSDVFVPLGVITSAIIIISISHEK